MWFTSNLIYQFELNEDVDFNECLTEERLKPCPPHARTIMGWVPSFSDDLVHEVAGVKYILLGREERILPKTVINRFLKDKIQQIEIEQARTVKRAERAQMAEDIEFDLLPKAFCIQKNLGAIIDFASGHIFVNTTSITQAQQFLALLKKSIPAIQIEPLISPENLAMKFATWITNPETLPNHIQLGFDCSLFSLDNEKKRISCKGYELPSEEVLSLLEQGLAVAEISLIWNERIQFTLTQDFIFKRLKCTDYLLEDFNQIRDLEEDFQQQDAALTLLAGELRSLVTDMKAYFNQSKVKTTQPTSLEMS